MLSTSGLRGIANKDLTANVVFQYALMFGQYIGKGRIIIGRDTRESGRIFRKAVVHGLNSAGCTVIDLGIVPTPTVLFMVKELRARGGIAVTASHNPVQWNALKFVSRRGQFLHQQEFKGFLKYIDRHKISGQTRRKFSNVKLLRNSVDRHIKRIIKVLKPISERFRVGVDAVNAAGSIALPRIVERMGCKVYRFNCKFSPRFPRKPEPTPGNIRQFCKFVKDKRLDFGVACDPDCDRLSIVDENGKAIGEENTIVLAAEYVLNRKKGNVVTNLSTSALMGDVVKMHNCRLYRSKVGEANVVAKMEQFDALIGGEGNGGVIYPKINFTRDALVAVALLIKLVAERNKMVSEILAKYPKYYMLKKKMRISKERFEKRKKKIIRAFGGRPNFIDGLRITASDYWLHIRPSQTEPLLRIIGEARSRRQIEKHIATVERILS